MKMNKIKTALIGSGMISEIYLKNLQKSDIIELKGCSDIIPERAAKRAEQFSVKQMTNEEIFADPEISLIINTTYPLAHYEVAKQALTAGKHVYTEKMITETNEQIDELLKLSKEKNLFCGGAPDTFLSGSAQLARSIADSEILGKPVSVDAFLSRSYHHERFYTGNEKRFAFCRHGGIIFDMGAYYLTQMIFLLGAIDSVTGFAQIRDANRVYSNPKSPLYGSEMLVESWNNISGAIRFKNGSLGHITMTSESVFSNRFIIYFTNGLIDMGDPNNYEDHIIIKSKNGSESVINTPFSYSNDNLRGIGAVEAMYALKNNRTPRCNGELNRHVLEAALGICESGMTGKIYKMKTECERPEPLKPGYTEYPEMVFNI